jgi:hypothetical protein
LGGLEPPALPVEVTIQDLYPAAINPLDTIQVVVMLRNTSRAAVDIPASRDYAHVIKPGNHDQTELRLKLLVAAPGATDRLLSLLVGTAVGSSSVPGSFVVLPPNGTMLVRGEASLLSTRTWREKGVGETADLVVNAAFDQLHYDDNRYFMNAVSREAVSVNAAHVFWRSR